MRVTTRLTLDDHGEPTWVVEAHVVQDGLPVLGQGPTLELAAADVVRNLRALNSPDFQRLDRESQWAVREGMSRPGSLEGDMAAHPADRVFRNA